MSNQATWKNKNVYVSKHARVRFVTRFKLKFHPSYFINDSMTDSLIETLIKNSRVDASWRLSPFYRNKVESKHGPTKVFVSDAKGITFICAPLNNGDIIVRTVVKSFDPTK